MSKAGMRHATKAKALELTRHGIRVNALLLSYIATNFNQEFLSSARRFLPNLYNLCISESKRQVCKCRWLPLVNQLSADVNDQNSAVLSTHCPKIIVITSTTWHSPGPFIKLPHADLLALQSEPTHL
jgi:Enoyl-(Acyl carrier protein) reductase